MFQYSCTNRLQSKGFIWVDWVCSYRQKTHLWRWQKADYVGRYSQSLYEAAAGRHMHHQGALWPMLMRRRSRRGPDGPVLSLHDGGRMMRRRRMWMGDRSLSLCDGGFYWGLGPPQPLEGAPQRKRWGRGTRKDPEEVAEREVVQRIPVIHCFRKRPLRKKAASPGFLPPWRSWAGRRLPAPSWGDTKDWVCIPITTLPAQFSSELSVYTSSKDLNGTRDLRHFVIIIYGAQKTTV